MITLRTTDGLLGDVASAHAMSEVQKYCSQRNLPNINAFFKKGWTQATQHTSQEIEELVKFDTGMPLDIKGILKTLAKLLLRANEIAILN